MNICPNELNVFITSFSNVCFLSSLIWGMESYQHTLNYKHKITDNIMQDYSKCLHYHSNSVCLQRKNTLMNIIDN